MAKERKITLPPGHVNTETAAAMLHVSTSRIYQYVDDGRLTPYKVGNAFLFLIKEIEQVRRNPSGRSTTKQRPWRAYKGNVNVIETEIIAQVREGQQEALSKKLQDIRAADQFKFPGTLARYIFQEKGQPTVQIFLIWKSTNMPEEAVLQGYLAMFQAELADVLEWERAEVHTREALLYT